MQHAEQVAQIRELLGHIDNHTVPQADRVLKCPTSAFTDAEQARAEYAHLFQDHPQMIGLSGELKEPNSYFTLNDFGVTILATRDKSGRFRAFLNACRHRGSAVAEENSRGKRALFVCPYHAWSYASDGALVAVREKALFGDVDQACNGLVELPSQEKFGMLWVHPRVDGKVDLDAQLGPELSAELESWRFDQSEYRAELTFARPLNWKLASDTFCEAYHFGVLHKNTVANVVHGDFSTYRTYGRNHRMIVPNRNIPSVLEKPEARWHLPSVAVVAYYLFPNVHMISNGNILSITRIYPNPEKPGESVSKITIFGSDHLLQGDEKQITGDNVYEAKIDQPIALDVSVLMQLFDTTVDKEDYAMACQMQRSADSGLMPSVQFGRNEPGVQHAHNAIREAIGMPALEPA